MRRDRPRQGLPYSTAILGASMILRALATAQDDTELSRESDKAVAKPPSLIKQMNADLSWMVEQGQAFVEQPKDLINAIQRLRAKAHGFGNLKTTADQLEPDLGLETGSTAVGIRHYNPVPSWQPAEIEQSI